MILVSGGAVVGALGAFLGRPWGFLGPLGANLDRPGAVLARLEAILSRLDALMGPQEAQEAKIIDFTLVLAGLGAPNGGRQIGSTDVA